MIKLTDKQINDALAGTKYDEQGKCFGSITYLGLGVRNRLNDAEINAARAIIMSQILADIRHKTGIGQKPILSELADALKQEIRLQYYNGMFDAAESLAKQFEHEGWEARAADIRRRAYEWAGQFKVPAEQQGAS